MRLRHATIYWTGFSIIIALLIVAPLVLPEFWRRLLTEILIWGLLAMSSDLLIGYTGMVSFGHSAFFGLGMYGAAAALLSVRPPSLWLAIAMGLLAAAAVAAFVAYFSTRLRDIYFAITTLIFSQIFYVIIFTWTEVTGGENGLTFGRPALAIPGLFSVPFTSETLHWFVLGAVTLSYLVLRRITQSPFGMVLQSIRENEARTRAIGYPVERYKIVAVMLSGLFAGLAGVLYAIQNRFAAPDFVFFVVSGEVVIYNVIGGIGTLVGPIVGAGFFLLLREGFSRFFTEYYLIPVGVIFVAMVIFMPQGLLGFARRWLTADSAVRRYLTNAIFPYYIVHQTAIILVAHELRDSDLPAWLEAGIVIAGTVVTCALTYEIVRRIAVLRPLFGLKVRAFEPAVRPSMQPAQ